jgi:hypothetical protein
MATKKSTNTENNQRQKLFDVAPYIVPSAFELETFNATEGSAGFARRVIEVINKIRELESQVNSTAYEKMSAQANIQVLTNWLNGFDQTKLANVVANWQDSESSYWVDALGKKAAIEIISENKISKDTMEKMTMLPEQDYIRATQLCVKLANAIKGATVKAEEAIGVVTPTEQPAKKGLNLKKM